MFKSSFFLGLVLILTIQPTAYAQNSKSMTPQSMCVSAADMPKPYGEWDLKGNAKLKEYCSCFGSAFEARAVKMSMTSNGKPPSLEQSNKEELELRNACRKKLGLPLAVAS